MTREVSLSPGTDAHTPGLRRAIIVLWLAALAVLLFLGCAGSVETAQVELGRKIYTQNCQGCHGDPATGENATHGAANHGPGGHTWHHADGQLVDIILGRLNHPGRQMPSFEGKLSEDEVMVVLAYIKTGWLPEQREFQAEVSQNWENMQNRRP